MEAEENLTSTSLGQPGPEFIALRKKVDALSLQIEKVLVGQTEIVELLLATMLSGGHVLLEGVPGVAKTMIAKLLSRTVDADFSRIQFTPDLMPADVTGTTLLNSSSNEFEFKQGPVFGNIILVDEINRAPAKTQAAMFEVMEEHQVTYDGKTYKMGFPFFVVATQNPVEQEGTYRLPEAQLDRFMCKINVPYPNLEEETDILMRFKDDFDQKSLDTVQSVITKEDLKNLMHLIEKVQIKDELVKYIAGITLNTRDNPDLFLGASPRASLSIMKLSKAWAAMSGRDFVTPEDIKKVCVPVLNHRLILNPEKEMEGLAIEDVIKDVVEQVEVPR